MGQCEITENQTEQNKSHAVAAIEAHPTPPHCGFFRNDRCNLVHADLQCGVTGREVWPPERIDEVDDSERKDNARTKNHENFGGQDALPILRVLCSSLSALQRFLYLLVTLHILDSIPHHSFDEIRSPACARALRSPRASGVCKESNLSKSYVWHACSCARTTFMAAFFSSSSDAVRVLQAPSTTEINIAAAKSIPTCRCIA